MGIFRLLTAMITMPGKLYPDSRRVEQVWPPRKRAGSRHLRSTTLHSRRKLATACAKEAAVGPWVVFLNVIPPWMKRGWTYAQASSIIPPMNYRRQRWGSKLMGEDQKYSRWSTQPWRIWRCGRKTSLKITITSRTPRMDPALQASAQS